MKETGTIGIDDLKSRVVGGIVRASKEEDADGVG